MKSLIALILLALPLVLPAQNPDIIFSEVCYHNDSTRTSGDWVELYNKGGSAIDMSGWVFQDMLPSHFFLIPSGTILGPGERLVLVEDAAKFKVIYPSVTNYVGDFVFSLSNKSDHLKLYDLNNNLYVQMTYADSLNWPEGADGNGRTLEIVDVNGNLNDPFNWFDGCMWGSPGSPYTPCVNTIVINEINYNSSKSKDAGDWVELKNVSASPIDISNWTMRNRHDSVGYKIPSGFILQPGEKFVLFQDWPFLSQYPSVWKVSGPFLFGLRNSKDDIRLFNASGVLEYSVSYRDEYPWPAGADGNGYTLELLDPAGKMNTGGNWRQGCIGGSPGADFNTVCAVSVNEAEKEILFKAYPVPASYELTVESSTPGELLISDFTGRSAMKTQVAEGISQLDVSSLAPGIYSVTISSEGSVSSVKLQIIR